MFKQYVNAKKEPYLPVIYFYYSVMDDSDFLVETKNMIEKDLKDIFFASKESLFPHFELHTLLLCKSMDKKNDIEHYRKLSEVLKKIEKISDEQTKMYYKFICYKNDWGTKNLVDTFLLADSDEKKILQDFIKNVVPLLKTIGEATLEGYKKKLSKIFVFKLTNENKSNAIDPTKELFKKSEEGSSDPLSNALMLLKAKLLSLSQALTQK